MKVHRCFKTKIVVVRQKQRLVLNTIMVFVILAVACTTVISEVVNITFNIWPTKVAPGDENVDIGPEEWSANNEYVRNVTVPTLSYFWDPQYSDHYDDADISHHQQQANRSRPAMLVLCGGGYQECSIKKEGYEIARYLNTIGIAAFVLKYRVPDRHALKPTIPQYSYCLMDVQRSMNIIRGHQRSSGGFHIDPNRVGIIGFSAGGHLATMLSTTGWKKLLYSIGNNDAAGATQPNLTAAIY